MYVANEQSHSVKPEFIGCRFASNSSGYGGAAYLYFSSPHFTDCEFEDNTGSMMGATATSGDAQIHDTGGAATVVTYTDIDQDGFGGGIGNIRSDPFFVTGPRGDYYLSHISTGQASDSPCIDKGIDTAISFGLHILTTRIDGVTDILQADLGFHYEPDN